MLTVIKGHDPGYYTELRNENSGISEHALLSVERHHLRRIAQSVITATIVAVQARLNKYAVVQYMGTLAPKIMYDLNRLITSMETSPETQVRTLEKQSIEHKVTFTKVLAAKSGRVVEFVEEMNGGKWEPGNKDDAFAWRSVSNKLREEWAVERDAAKAAVSAAADKVAHDAA